MGRLRALLIAGAGLAAAGGIAGLGLAQDTNSANPPAAPPATTPAPAGAPVAGTVPAADVPPEESAPTTPAPVKAVDNETAAADEPNTTPPALPKPVEPLKRPRYISAVLQALDKVTAKTLRFEAKVGEPMRYQGLVLTVHACETTAPDEEVPDSIVHLEVVSQPQPVAGVAPAPRQIYRGWMFASSPGLHPFTSPGYDLWLIACKTPSPAEPAPAAGVVGSR